MFRLGMDGFLLVFAAGILFSLVSGSPAPIHEAHLEQSLSLRDNTTQIQLFNFTGLSGLTATCIEAMQMPVSCHPAAMELLLSSQGRSISNTASPVKLTADDLADLCTVSCADSLASLNAAVGSACSGAILSAPPSNGTAYLPGTEAQESIFGGDGATTFGPSLAVDLVLLSYKLSCMRDAAVADAKAAWCRLRFAQNLTQVCDDCELGAYRVHMEDAPGGYDVELAAQYTASISSCGKPLTPLTTPTTTGGGYASSPIATTNGTNGTNGCVGTMVPVTADTRCDDFARINNISTEQLLSLNGLTSGCVGFPGGRTALCVEGGCKTYTVRSNDNCTSIVKAAGITAVQFLSWNPMIGTRGCNTDLARQIGHVVCVGNPLPYTTPPSGTNSSASSTSTSLASPISGFDQFENLTSIWTHSPLLTIVPTNTSTTAAPWETQTYDLAPGSLSGCYYMYNNAVANLSCMAVAARYGVDQATWVSWNPSVLRGGDSNQTAKGEFTQIHGGECHLDADTKYCGLFWNPLLATPHSDIESPYAPKPGDATEGATDECYVWDQTPAETIDNLCQVFVDSEGITVSQLYAWNPAVGKFSLWPLTLLLEASHLIFLNR